MQSEKKILGLTKTAEYIKNFLTKNENDFSENDLKLKGIIIRSQQENSWFTQDNIIFALTQWSELLTEDCVKEWVREYEFSSTKKRVGLILAGNIPLVGFHDVMSVILSGHDAVIKLSSKDRLLIPFILDKWNEFSEEELMYSFVDKLENFDAIIATGSNNTSRYLEYYFKNYPSIIRKNRTSVGVLKGDETSEELELLAEDIFRYFGMGCRNVTRIFIPDDFVLDRLFESFVKFGDCINHHSYANNYDYHKAIYLLNQELFWDNNFIMLKESEELFSPLSVLNFSRYKEIDEVVEFISDHDKEIQCIVSKPNLISNSEYFGMAQKPNLNTYADDVDTMSFLSNL